MLSEPQVLPIPIFSRKGKAQLSSATPSLNPYDEMIFSIKTRIFPQNFVNEPIIMRFLALLIGAGAMFVAAIVFFTTFLTARPCVEAGEGWRQWKRRSSVAGF